MTRIAKLNAPTISFDRPAQVLQPASARQPGPPASQAGSPPAVENELVAELESALQAVITRESRLENAGPSGSEAAVPADAAGEEEAPETGWQYSDVGAISAMRPPSLLVRPADVPAPAKGVASELTTPADERRPGLGEPRRRSLPLRAALCIAGLGLVGAGGAALILAAAPDEQFVAPLARHVKTETVQAAASAPATTEAQLQAAAREPASEGPVIAPLAKQVKTETIRFPAVNAQPDAAERETGGGEPITAPAAGAETPAAEVTLLRPVGESGSSGTTAQPAERSPLVQEQPQPDGAAQSVKAPDRLINAPVREAPIASFADGAEEGGIPTASPAAELTNSGTERLPSEPSSAAGEESVAAVPLPLSDEALVARSGPETEGGAAAPGGAGSDEQPGSEQDAASGSPGSADRPGQAEAAASGEPARSAPVTTAVNMRAGPDNDAAVLAVVPAGSKVGVIGCDFWCEVVFGGERGWIYKSFVRGADS